MKSIDVTVVQCAKARGATTTSVAGTLTDVVALVQYGYIPFDASYVSAPTLEVHSEDASYVNAAMVCATGHAKSNCWL